MQRYVEVEVIYFQLVFFMLRLDVCIEGLDIVLGRMSNTQDIDIKSECQYLCLGVLDIHNPDKILKLNTKCCLDGKVINYSYTRFIYYIDYTKCT
jgi:hypothetical protein